MLDQHELKRPLAYHLARRVASQSVQAEQSNPQMQDAGGTLEVTGSQSTSLDVIYDF